ncbi:MAG: FAD-binding domain-containing protein [Pseudomonadota bacterium]
MTRTDHPATRTEALSRLSAFVPLAGRDYAAKRNYDIPGHPHVSVLSPYIRHRLITEEEVLEAVLGRYSPKTAEKFIQEVFWRTYWKGWLELRPSVWASYQTGVRAALDRVATESGLRSEWEAACKGDTGIDAFDHWAQELVQTGYLHNHARMWFASIWIFTLRLPWELGADFFLRHLLDGDPASNTLSWRWVAGLQTKGKNYVARASNISRYTEGRFSPTGLTADPAPLDGPPHPPRMAPPEGDAVAPSLRTGVLLHDDDLSPGYFLTGLTPVATASLLSTSGRSPLEPADNVSRFTTDATTDATTRFADRLGTVAPPTNDVAAIVTWAQENDLQQIVTPFAPTGPAADQLSALSRALPDDIRLARILRPYDATCWPDATAGFFKFKERIPKFIDALNLKTAA